MKTKQVNSKFEDNFILFHPVKTYRIARGDTLSLYLFIIFLAITLFTVISKTAGIDKVSVSVFIAVDMLWIIRLSGSIADKINKNK